MLIHRWWNGPKFDGYEWIESVVSRLGRVMEHGDSMTLDDRVRPSDQVRHFSNVLRLKVLYQHGGLWLDSDVIPIANLVENFPYTASFRGKREGAVMWFPSPGHPWLLNALRKMPEGIGRAKCTDVSGANFLNAMPDMDVKRIELFSHDAIGRVASQSPRVVHLWHTTSHILYDRGLNAK